MPIVPDTANWTWVLERACPACGLDASRIEFDTVADLTEDNVDRWPRALDVADPALRPDDHTWSPLEYAAHVRDVFRIFGVRLDMMLAQTDPLFDNWDQDATAIAERYGEQDPAVVLAELRDAGLALARDFRAVPPPRACAPVGAVTAACSPSRPSRGTSSTTRCITSSTSPANASTVGSRPSAGGDLQRHGEHRAVG